METREDWTGLSLRIRGLTEASNLAANLLTRGDSQNVNKHLREHTLEILNDLRAFGDRLGESDKDARAVIQSLAKMTTPILVETGNRDSEQISVRSAIVIIAAMEGKISYLFHNSEDVIRSRTERAFEHLNRTIVVDSDYRTKWKAAYDHHETTCEALGGVHLLSHGIWAFKAKGPKAETDLVYQEALSDIGRIKRGSDGLVLTEWKRLKEGDDPANQFESARKQAEEYATGILRDIILRKYRYAVLVSQKAVAVPDDKEIGNVIYRHINVVVQPTAASKQRQ